MNNFFFSSRRRHTRSLRDWSSDVCSSDLRNQALLVVLTCVPMLIAIAIKVTNGGNGDNGRGDGGALFGNITANKVFVAFSALFVVIPLFLPMAVAVVAGDAVSGEANLGRLRYLLAVPVGRTRLLAVKF